MVAYKLANLSVRKVLFSAGLIYGMTVAIMLILSPSASAAPCALPSTDFGTVTQTVSVPQAGSYRVWSRMAVPNATDNSFLMEVDGNTCFTVGDGSFNVASWNNNSTNWVDYQSGTTTNKINVSLTAGSHTIKLIGNAANVKVDRVILTSDAECVPIGTGDNCASPPDIWEPTTAITSPTNGSTRNSGTTITISATAADDINGSGIKKVDFVIDGTVVGSDSTSPYSYGATGLSVGQHNLAVRAYDVAGNMATSSTISINVVIPPDTTKPTVSIASPASGSTQTGTITVTANASDNVGVARVEFYVDGSLVGADTTTSSFTHSLNTTSLTNGSHVISARAYDTATPTANSATSSNVTITVNNTTAPPPDTTKPTVSIASPASNSTQSGAITVTASASDNVGVARVEFFVDGQSRSIDTSAAFSFSLDTTSLSNGVHTLTAVAYDTAATPNSQTSAAVYISVNNNSYIDEDINQDGKVNLLDFSLLSSKYGQSGSGIGRSDINKDGTVNLLDFSRLASRYGYGT